jgi:catechol 2,3-dioxygenase-like lactoylglutathione lyase family enzyme
MNTLHFCCLNILTGSTDKGVECEQFYVENFGMQLVKPRSDEAEDDFIVLTDNAGSGGEPLWIVGDATAEWEHVFLEKHGPGINYISFEVSDVDAAYEMLISKGVSFHVRPYDYMGTRVAWCRDPAGVDIELFSGVEFPEIERETPESVAPPARLNHVAILVGSRELAEKVERFYQDFFGMEEVFRGDPTRLDMDWVYFEQAGGANPFWLEIVGATNFPKDLEFLDKHGPGMDHICFVVESADEYFEWLKGRDVELVSDLIDYAGARMFYLRDPVGVLVQVIQMPEDGI